FVAADSTQSALISHAVALFLVGDVNHCLGSTVLASYRQRRQVRRRDSEYRMFGHWRFPLPWRFLPSRRKSGVGEPPTHDRLHNLHEAPAVAVRHATLIEAEDLFVNVRAQVEGFHIDVGALERPLEQAPEVFKPVGVDMSLDVR